METITSKPVDGSSNYENSIDFWRQKRGFTWKQLAAAVGCKYPVLHRTARTTTERLRAGGSLGRTKMARLAQVLEVQVWELHLPESETRKKFPLNIPK